MKRSRGVELVKKYDHIISKDLKHWLNYVELKENIFWKVADKFRDPRVWWIKNNQWYKYNLWGGYSPYGYVYLNKDEKEKFNLKRKKLLEN